MRCRLPKHISSGLCTSGAHIKIKVYARSQCFIIDKCVGEHIFFSIPRYWFLLYFIIYFYLQFYPLSFHEIYSLNLGASFKDIFITLRLCFVLCKSAVRYWNNDITCFCTFQSSSYFYFRYDLDESVVSDGCHLNSMRLNSMEMLERRYSKNYYSIFY